MAAGPRILAVETTARQGGLALALGEALLDSVQLPAERDYAAELLPAADRLCKQCGWEPGTIEHVYVSAGPGSFTGARIGVTFAKTLGIACGASLVPVPTLEVIAANALRIPEPPPRLVVLIDARRGQVFAQGFELTPDRSDYRPVDQGRLVGIDVLLEQFRPPWAALGEGAAPHAETLRGAGIDLLSRELWDPRPEAVHAVGWRMARQGRFTPPDRLVPMYFRLPTPEERLRRKMGG